MFRFSSLVDNVNEWVAKFGLLIVPTIALIGTYEVVSRYVFSRPTNWVWEISTEFLCVACAMGAGYALLKGTHVKVDVVYTRFPRRVRAILDSVTSVFAIIFLGVLMWQGALKSWHSILVREVTHSILHSPMYPYKSIIVIGCAFFLLQVLANLVRSIYTAYTGKETTEPKTQGDIIQ